MRITSLLLAFVAGGALMYLAQIRWNSTNHTAAAHYTSEIPASAPLSGMSDITPASAPNRDEAIANVASLHTAQTPTSLKHIANIPSDVQRMGALYQRILAADSNSLARWLAESKAIFAAHELSDIQLLLVKRFAEVDPAQALAHVTTSAQLSKRQQQSWIQVIFARWAKQNLDHAIAALAGLEQKLRLHAVRGIVLAQPQTGPDALADSGFAAAHKPVSAYTLDELLDTWQEAMQLNDKRMRVQTLSDVAKRWVVLDPQAALGAINDLPLALRRRLERSAISQWANTDPAAAVDWLTQQPTSALRGRLLSQTLGKLAQHDFDQARYIADGLTGLERQQAFSAVMPRLADQDLDAALSWFAEQSDKRLRERLISMLTRKLQRDAPERLDTWLAGLETAEASQVQSLIVRHQARSNPAAAADGLANIENPSQRQAAAAQVMSNWVAQDPNAAAQWIELQPWQEQANLYQLFAAQWSRWDLNSAISFAQQLGSDLMQSKALLGTMNGASDANTLLEIFDSISHSKTKDSASTEVLARLLQLDPDAADRFKERIQTPASG